MIEFVALVFVFGCEGTISWSEFMIAISELRRRQETDVNAGRSVTLKDREAALDELEKIEEELSEKYEGALQLLLLLLT